MTPLNIWLGILTVASTIQGVAMSQGYNNKGRFGLWRNKDRKELTHPHLSGQGEDLDGNKVWTSAWFSKDLSDEDKQVLAEMIKRYEGANKKPFINIVIKSKQAVHSQGVANASAAAQSVEGFDDDIPF